MRSKISIGFAGLAKNVGKTTALISVLEGLKSRGISVALTSIGYDGEDIDNITGLPKPKYFLSKGDLIATSRKCLVDELEVLRRTGIETPLGDVVIARVREETSVILAGPNKADELASVLGYFFEEGAGIALVDGSINRVYPLKIVDKLVISTGLVRGSLERIKLEVEALNFFASIPKVELKENVVDFLPLDFLGYRGRRLILRNALNLLLSEDFVLTYLRLKKYLSAGGFIGTLNPLRISAITVSTFYLRRLGDKYESNLADVDLEKALAFSRIPVVDVKKGRNGDRLTEIVLSRVFNLEGLGKAYNGDDNAV